MPKDIIPAKELRHKVIIRHAVEGDARDEYGQFKHTIKDKTEKCHYEFADFHAESQRVQNKEFVARYDVFLMTLPTAEVKKGDVVLKIISNNGDIAYEEEGDGNPMVIDRILRIPADDGIHHIELYCKLRNPKINA